jgi:hypothetical protein
MLAGRSLVVPVDSPALISQSRRKILPAKILPATGGASASDIGCAAADVEGARHSAACRSVCRASHGRVFWRALPAIKSQRRRQTLLSMTGSKRHGRANAKLGAHAHPRFSAVDQNRKLGKMPPFGTTSGAHPDKPKERPDAQSHAHPCDRTAVRRIGGPHRRRANLARGQ